MRDPARIDDMCKTLARIWKKVPDMRMGQLVWAASPRPDPFHVEDDEMFHALLRFEREYTPDANRGATGNQQDGRNDAGHASAP